MIKQITVSNILNFKEEFTIDFTGKKIDDTLYRIYNKDVIGNFALIYGKNNVGKSNFFRILSEVQRKVFHNRFNLEAYNPSGEDEDSLFEVVVENDNNEIRYGFVCNFKDQVIHEEWLLSKLNKSSRETLIFERGRDIDSHSFNKTLKVSDVKVMTELKRNILFLNHFSNISKPSDVIRDLLDELSMVLFISCLGGEDDLENIPGFISLYENETSYNILNLFLKSADLDIVNIKFSELSEIEKNFINIIRSIDSLDVDEEVKQAKFQKTVKENMEMLPTILKKNLLGKRTGEDDVHQISMEFIHRTGASFRLEELSTGTKQIISILLRVVGKIGSKSVFIFDEIETGLHPELISLLLNFFKLLSTLSPDQQFIITTHNEELLDLDFISNYNKVFFKYSNDKSTLYPVYLSEYAMREYQVPSKRYKLNAFETSPNTSSEYELHSYIKKIVETKL